MQFQTDASLTSYFTAKTVLTVGRFVPQVSLTLPFLISQAMTADTS